jgi:small subunit ribosomal protein S20
MANTSSAKKMIRKIERKTEINRQRRSKIRSLVRFTEEVMEEGDKERATQALKNAQPEMMKGAAKGLFHKKTISRKISRLAKRLNGMSSSPSQ